jgi:hypothetical protein
MAKARFYECRSCGLTYIDPEAMLRHEQHCTGVKPADEQGLPERPLDGEPGSGTKRFEP